MVKPLVATTFLAAGAFMFGSSCHTAPNSGAGAGDSPCRSQCELAAGECNEQPLESFASFSTQLEAWRGEQDSELCQAGHVGRYRGECSNDRLILVEDLGEVSYFYIYDRSTGAFLGLRSITDVLDWPCEGVGYWPEMISCGDPVVKEVVCGDDYEVGDALWLPRVVHR